MAFGTEKRIGSVSAGVQQVMLNGRTGSGSGSRLLLSRRYVRSGKGVWCSLLRKLTKRGLSGRN